MKISHVITNKEPRGKITLTKYNEDKSAVIPQTTYLVTGPNGYSQSHNNQHRWSNCIRGIKTWRIYFC